MSDLAQRAARIAEIPGVPGYYADESGNIYGMRGLMKPQPKSGGKSKHLQIRCNHKNYAVHRLVLLAFKGRPPSESHVARHLDGNPLNNKIENLEWGTPLENYADAVRHGTAAYGNKCGKRKISALQAIEIFSLKGKEGARKIAPRYGVSRSAVMLIWKGENWRRVLIEHGEILEQLNAKKHCRISATDASIATLAKP